MLYFSEIISSFQKDLFFSIPHNIIGSSLIGSLKFDL